METDIIFQWRIILNFTGMKYGELINICLFPFLFKLQFGMTSLTEEPNAVRLTTPGVIPSGAPRMRRRSP